MNYLWVIRVYYYPLVRGMDIKNNIFIRENFIRTILLFITIGQLRSDSLLKIFYISPK